MIRTSALISGFVFAGTNSAQAQNVPVPAVTQPKNDYSDGETWLCRPGRERKNFKRVS